MVRMAAPEVKPLSTGAEMKRTMKPACSQPSKKRSAPLINVSASTAPT